MYFENRYFHKDGTIRWLLWASTSLADQQLIYAAARETTVLLLGESGTGKEVVARLLRRSIVSDAETRAIDLNLRFEIQQPSKQDPR